MGNKSLQSLFLLGALLFFSTQTCALDREYTIKSALVFNFARYSQHQTKPLSPTSHYAICSTSKPFIKAAENTLNQKTIESKPIKTRLITPEQKQNHCNIIYFDDITLFQRFIENEHDSKTLLIGHSPNFISMGGHINFIIIGGKLRFEINPEQLAESGIKISSKVIRLGIVKQGKSQ